MQGDREVHHGLRAALADDTFARRFEVGEPAGEGGMGRVHRALDRESGTPVAIKVLAAAGDEARFTLEAEALEKLSHPAIVAYVGHGVTSGGDAYLAMAWLEGTSLAKRLSDGPLAIDDTLAIGIRIASALVHAHARGLIHRDLKPSNVMLVEGAPEQATLIDFGIAKHTASTDKLTGTGQLIGTPAYMAPEQARGTAASPSMDVFGLGVLLYECLGGRPPFDGDQTVEVLARLLLEQPVPIDELRPELPYRLATLIDALLEKDPSRRIATAQDVETELRAIRDALARGDRATLATRPAFLPAPVKQRSRRIWIAGTGLVVAIVAVIAVVAIAARDGERASDGVEPAKEPKAQTETEPDPRACKKTNTCEAACTGGDGGACEELGRERYMAARDQAGRRAALAVLERGCDLGNSRACTLAGMWTRQLVMRGDRELSREGWVALYERACSLEPGRPCMLLAGYLLAESPASSERALALYDRGCTSVPAACYEAAQLLVHRDREGDLARANELLVDACKRGFARACK